MNPTAENNHIPQTGVQGIGDAEVSYVSY